MTRSRPHRTEALAASRFASVIAIGAACGLLLATAIAAAAQEPREAPADEGLIETTTSELVLIEVYVTDRQGQPVRDLTVDDFVLKIDRRKKPINSLEYTEIAPPKSTAAAAPDDLPTAAPDAGVEVNRVPRRFVLFFDDATSAPSGMGAARRAAEEFITGSLVPDDQVAFVTYDNARKMEARIDFTTDRELLREAIEKSLQEKQRISDFASRRLVRLDEIHDILNAPSLSSAGASQVSGVSEAGRRMRETQARMLGRSYAREDSVTMERVLGSIQMMVDVLAAWPGYKALVYLGDGIPENPGADYALLDVRETLTSQLGLLTRAAAAAGVTLHTVKTSGLGAGGSAEVRSSTAGGVTSLGGGAARRSNALQGLAHGTGGMALTSNDMLKALNDIEVGSRAFYLLGYVPEGPPDGLFHSVTVKVKQGGTRVRYRRGFVRLLPDQARERAVQAAHLLPELSPDLGLELSAIPGPRDGKSRLLDLVLYVPANQVIFLPGDDRLVARMEIGLVALDAAGRESYRVARRVRVGLTLEQIAARGSLGFNFYSRVRLPRSSQTITAVVSDLQGSSIGATRLSLDAADGAPAGVVGLSVYSLEEQSMWIELAQAATDRHEEAADMPYTLGPALRASFAADEPVTCGFRVLPAADGATPELRLVILQGEDVVRSTPFETDVGAEGSVKVPVSLAGLASGPYVLRVEAGDTPGKGSDLGSLPIRIR